MVLSLSLSLSLSFAKRQTPNAKRQMPNAKCQTPNAKRQTPNAEFTRQKFTMISMFTIISMSKIHNNR